MTREAFDYWVDILRAHFPTHQRLTDRGRPFVPCLPEEAAAIRSAHARAHPVAALLDQDGARRIDPSEKDLRDWLEMMNPGDTLALRHRDGGALKCAREHDTYGAACLDASGACLAEATGLDGTEILEIGGAYLAGHVTASIKKLRAVAARPPGR
jgi:hypothetical protein